MPVLIISENKYRYFKSHDDTNTRVLSLGGGLKLNALSASKAIFRARKYSRITYSVRWLLDEGN